MKGAAEPKGEKAMTSELPEILDITQLARTRLRSTKLPPQVSPIYFWIRPGLT